jgi:hypothetical protein
MHLDAGTVDKQLIGYVFGPGKCAENAFPYAALRPADEPIVERLLRTVDIGAVGPTATGAQGMNDPAQHTTVINALHSPHVCGQKRRDPIPLRIRKPKKSVISLPPKQRH